MKRILLKKSRIDENKASLAKARSWILMQEFLLKIMFNYHSVNGNELDKKS